MDCRSLAEAGPGYLLPLQLTMTQSWFPVSADFPPPWYRCNAWAFSSYVPWLLNGPLWYVSTLVGCYGIYIVVFQSDEDGFRCVVKAGVCASVRAVTDILSRSSKDSFGPLFQIFPHLDLFGLCKHFPPAACSAFFAGVYTGTAVRLLPSRIFLWRGWLFMDVILLAVVLVTLRRTDTEFAGRLCPVFCLFAFAAACDHRTGLLIRTLSHPALVALAPGTYAAYAFSTPYRDAMHHSGWELSVPNVFSFYVVTLFTGALIYDSLLDHLLRTALSRALLRLLNLLPGVSESSSSPSSAED